MVSLQWDKTSIHPPGMDDWWSSIELLIAALVMVIWVLGSTLTSHKCAAEHNSL